MDLESKLRMYADLSCEILRNSAYYRAGWETKDKLKKQDSDFWVNLNGNFLDIAVLSWCFLFGDNKAKFKWQGIIDDHENFMGRLLAHLECSMADFNEYISCMRLYRDKRVAHWDEYLVGHTQIIYPCLVKAVQSTIFFYSALCEEYPQIAEIYAYTELNSFYESRLEMAEEQYGTTSA